MTWVLHKNISHASLLGCAGFYLLMFCVAPTVQAQVQDHLQCFKIKDPHRYAADVDVISERFGLSADCRITVKGSRYCAPASRFIASVSDGTPEVDIPGRELEFDRICYKLRCPAPAPGLLEVTDQFGTREVEFRRINQICTPAVRGSAAPECGNAIVEPGEQCDASACPTGGTCTAGCECICLNGDPSCPTTMEWKTLAGTGSEVTATHEDSGTTGIGHDADMVELGGISLRIACGGTGPSSCGDCFVYGLDPSRGNCRCANSLRTTCDEPFSSDDDDCGGDVCECYTAPPLPRSHGNFPTCFLDSLANMPSGSWNVDAGSGTIDVRLRRATYLGETLNTPCPTCVGDTTLNDGVRDGVCVGGEHVGLVCDGNGTDATFPAPGGGTYSYDCAPQAEKLIGPASAMQFDVTHTTGKAALGRNVECGFPSVVKANCSCGACTELTSMACSNNADCAVVGAGSCDANGIFPDACQGECLDLGDGEGECDAAGPIDTFCDGSVRANGRGYVACLTNADCAASAIGFEAGDCTLSARRPCFLDPTSAVGTPDAAQPVTVAVSCMPPTTSPGANTLFGFPSPIRFVTQADTTFRCADSSFTYPNCP